METEREWGRKGGEGGEGGEWSLTVETHCSYTMCQTTKRQLGFLKQQTRTTGMLVPANCIVSCVWRKPGPLHSNLQATPRSWRTHTTVRSKEEPRTTRARAHRRHFSDRWRRCAKGVELLTSATPLSWHPWINDTLPISGHWTRINIKRLTPGRLRFRFNGYAVHRLRA